MQFESLAMLFACFLCIFVRGDLLNQLFGA